MPRNMSFALTKDQIMCRTKFVTRRLGWWDLKKGDVVQAVEKGMGLKKGEKVNKLRLLRIISTRKEPLDLITKQDCELEGFPGRTPDEFISMFCEHNKCEPFIHVNRIAFDYID